MTTSDDGIDFLLTVVSALDLSPILLTPIDIRRFFCCFRRMSPSREACISASRFLQITWSNSGVAFEQGIDSLFQTLFQLDNLFPIDYHKHMGM